MTFKKTTYYLFFLLFTFCFTNCNTDHLVSSGSSIQKRKYKKGYYIKNIQKRINKLDESILSKNFKVENGTKNGTTKKNQITKHLTPKNPISDQRLKKTPKEKTPELLIILNDTIDTLDYFNPNYSNPTLHPKAQSSKKTGVILISTLIPALALSLLAPFLVPLTTITYLIIGLFALKNARKAKSDILRMPKNWSGLEEVGTAKALNWVVVGLCSLLLLLQFILILIVLSLFINGAI